MKAKLFASLMVLAALTGCNQSTDGTLAVEKELKIRVTVSGPSQPSPIPGQPGGPSQPSFEDRVLAPGHYEASLTMKSKSEAVLSIKADRTQEVSFKVPAGVQIPEAGGEFHLTAAQSGQYMDLHGTVTTRYEDSRTYREQESCTYQTTEQYCYHQPGHGTVCQIRTITHYGWRDVEYFVRTATKTINVALLDSADQSRIGAYDGSRTESWREYLYQSYCR